MPPSIDSFAPKNQELDQATVEAILGVVGLGPRCPRPCRSSLAATAPPVGSSATASCCSGALPAGAKLVAQVSRWDRLKDPRGLLECFAGISKTGAPTSPWSGRRAPPSPTIPRASRSTATSPRTGDGSPTTIRGRVHLVSLPMDDLDENAAMVNAIQRRGDVIVQKSLAEGFGLTVAEAMWKAQARSRQPHRRHPGPARRRVAAC